MADTGGFKSSASAVSVALGWRWDGVSILGISAGYVTGSPQSHCSGIGLMWPVFLPNSYQGVVPGRIGPLVASPSTDREPSRVHHSPGRGPGRIMTTHGSPDIAPGPSAGCPGARTILGRIVGFE